VGGESIGTFYIKGKETSNPEYWRTGLADPKKQWKTGKSAKALAYCWDEAGGFPPEVATTFYRCGLVALVRLEFVEGCIEHSTAVPGRGKASQTDLLVVAKSPDGIATVAVVGKVDEGFDKTVWEWGPHTSRNRSTRISDLCDWLKLPVSDVIINKIPTNPSHGISVD
jgi:hypothetical protein